MMGDWGVGGLTRNGRNENGEICNMIEEMAVVAIIGM